MNSDDVRMGMGIVLPCVPMLSIRDVLYNDKWPLGQQGARWTNQNPYELIGLLTMMIRVPMNLYGF